MTDEQLIRQIEQALADLKTGDEESAKEQLAAAFEALDVDVGDIRGQTALLTQPPRRCPRPQQDR